MKNPIESASAFAKYSAIAFQMILVIGVFTFLGYKLDEINHLDKPLFTAGLSLLGVMISLYLVIKSLKPGSKSNTENK